MIKSFLLSKMGQFSGVGDLLLVDLFHVSFSTSCEEGEVKNLNIPRRLAGRYYYFGRRRRGTWGVGLLAVSLGDFEDLRIWGFYIHRAVLGVFLHSSIFHGFHFHFIGVFLSLSPPPSPPTNR